MQSKTAYIELEGTWLNAVTNLINNYYLPDKFCNYYYSYYAESTDQNAKYWDKRVETDYETLNLFSKELNQNLLTRTVAYQVAYLEELKRLVEVHSLSTVSVEKLVHEVQEFNAWINNPEFATIDPSSRSLSFKNIIINGWDELGQLNLDFIPGYITVLQNIKNAFTDVIAPKIRWYDEGRIPTGSKQKLKKLFFDVDISVQNRNKLLNGMETLGLTINGESAMSRNKKSSLLGFVQAAMEKGLLPQQSEYDNCRMIANKIGMQLTAKLADSGVSNAIKKRARLFFGSNQ
jgi:hypothetical protein